jgi:DNA repair ATPase RecN
MRLKSIELVNFQAHRELLLRLDSPIVTLRGPTDAGKSAVIRALRWVCLNDLAGDDFVREGAKQTEVTLTLTDGNVIKRIRGGRTNTYELNGEEFKSFNSSVPDPIAALLCVNEINFQSQHDTPFWFNESPLEVSRRLNAVIDLSIIDSSLAYVATQVRTSQDRVRLTEERLDKARAELQEVEGQQARVEQFAQIKKQNDEFTRLKADYDKWMGIGRSISQGRDYLRDCADRAEDGAQVVTLGDVAFGLAQQCDSFSRLMQRIAQCEQQSTAPPDFTLVEHAYTQWDETQHVAQELFDLIEGIETSKASMERKLKIAAETEARVHKQLKGQICPLCQKPL